MCATCAQQEKWKTPEAVADAANPCIIRRAGVEKTLGTVESVFNFFASFLHSSVYSFHS